MKRSMLIFIAFTVCCLLPGNGFAKNDELPNGRPFQILQEEIDENAAAIAALNAEVAGLQTDVSALQAALSAIGAELDALDVRISKNTSDISDLFNDTALLSDLIAANRSSIEAIIEKHEDDLESINLEIERLDGELAALRDDLDEAVADLNSALATLNSAVEQNTSDVSGLLANVVILLGNVATIDATLSNHESRIATLESGQSDLNVLINNLVGELNNRIEILEGYHQQGITPGNTDNVVSSEGILGTGTIDFRCAEWSGDVCTRPQARVPSTTCGTYSEADVWHNLTYYNSPTQRICPSFCMGATGDGTVITCNTDGTTVVATPGGHVTSGYATSQNGCLSAGDYRWVADGIAYPTGFQYTTRFSNYGVGTRQLIIQCNW